MAKKSTQLLVDEPIRERIRALTLARGQLQADVLRRLIEAALPEFEQESEKRLTELHSMLGGMNVDTGRALEAMLKAKLPLEALRGKERFPLPLG